MDAGKPRKPQRPAPPQTRPSPKNSWTQAGLALTIPGLMVAGPLVGYGLGWLIRGATGWGRWVEIVLVLAGFVAGMRESIRVIRRLSSS